MVQARFAAMACMVGGATLLAPTAARACSCHAPTFTYPAEGDDVPTNTKVWISDIVYHFLWVDDEWAEVCDTERPRLESLDGTEVATRIESVEPWLLILVPQQELEPHTSYRIIGCSDDLVDRTLVLGEFTIGSALDTDPPPLPEAELGRFSYDDNTSCAHAFVEAHVDYEGVFAVVDVDSDADLDPYDPSGTVSAAFDSDTVLIGRGGCAYTWSEADRGARTTVRFATFDLAGHFSGWTDAEEVRFGCGCTHGGPRSRVTPWWLLLFVAIRRRSTHGQRWSPALPAFVLLEHRRRR